MSTFFHKYRFLDGYDDLPPHLWQPNMTCWYNILIMYPIIMTYGFKNILEIGQAEGYSSWYLANAARQNGGRFLAIDIEDTWGRAHQPCGYNLSRYFEGEGLPVTFIQSDTKAMKSIPSYADGGLDVIDFAYIDGEHKTDTILHEVYDLILPKMKGGGWSYIAMDDIVDMGAQGAWAVLKQDSKFEALGFHPNGGFGILRYMK